MSGSAGPSIQTDGLVFDYDMSNTQKSWKGAPMPNLYSKNNSNIDLNQFNGWGMPGVPGAVSEITTSYGLWNTNTIWRVTVGAGSILSYASWRQCVPASFDSTYGTTRRLSAKVKMISGLISNLGLHTGGGTGGATYTAIDPANIPVDVQDRNGWFLLDVDVSGSYPSGHCVGIGILAQNIQFLVAEMMLYPSAVLVPYTPTERLSTQAVLDLTNKNTITVNTLTYNANNTFSFNNSASSTFNIPDSTLIRSASVTISAWVNLSVYNPLNDFDGQFPTIAWKGFDGQSGSQASYSLTLVTGAFPRLTIAPSVLISSVAIPTNVWVNIVGTYTAGGAMVLYRNGEVDTTGTGPTSISYSAQVFGIGTRTFNGAYQYPWNGSIGMVQLYDRALSAAEVRQNFNAQRTRYGI